MEVRVDLQIGSQNKRILNQSNPVVNFNEIVADLNNKVIKYLTQGRESHLVFTLHIYQYLSNGQGGRSRLHLIDFGGCERTKVS